MHPCSFWISERDKFNLIGLADVPIACDPSGLWPSQRDPTCWIPSQVFRVLYCHTHGTRPYNAYRFQVLKEAVQTREGERYSNCFLHSLLIAAPRVIAITIQALWSLRNESHSISSTSIFQTYVNHKLHFKSGFNCLVPKEQKYNDRSFMLGKMILLIQKIAYTNISSCQPPRTIRPRVWFMCCSD